MLALEIGENMAAVLVLVVFSLLMLAFAWMAGR
jgi:hypothetical protein